MQDDNFLTQRLDAKTVARKFGCSPKLVRRAAAAGEIEHERLGSGPKARYRFTASGAEAWFAKMRRI